MPALVSDAELDALRRTGAGANRERMLREMAEALEALAREQSVILVFEDLHWSDRSTVDLIAYLARRREPARLMLVGTFRPADLVVREHPLKGVKHELQAHGQCAELTLELLDEGDVGAYVARRWDGPAAPPALARRVYERSDGNPLFMVNLVEHALHQAAGVAGAAGDVPATLQQAIEHQIACLPGDVQEVLEVAATVGMEFAAALVATVLGRRPDALEDLCDELAQEGRLLREAGVATWPDGTITAEYRFRHALYQQVLAQRLSEARRSRLHRLIGEQMEAAYGERAGEVAGALAAHFERGHDEQRALAFRRRAAETALRRSAYPEAIEHLERAVTLLRRQPDTPARAQEELGLTLALAPLVQVTQGYAAAATERAYDRARELSAGIDDPAQRFSVLLRLAFYALVRTRLQEARESAEGCLALARELDDPQRLADAHHALGCTLFWLGALEPAREHLERCLAVLEPRQHRWSPFGTGLFAPGSLALGQLGWTLWLLGHGEQAVQQVDQALVLARELGYPFNIGSTLAFAATVHQQRGDVEGTAHYVDAQLALAAREGYPHWILDGGFKRAWVLARRGQHHDALAQLRDVMTPAGATGPTVAQSYHIALAAEVLGEAGRAREGLDVLAAWLDRTPRSEERYYDAELLRWRGELLRRTADPRRRARRGADAETCFQHAMAVAREQQSRALELRAAASLARLWREQHRHASARALLAEVHERVRQDLAPADQQAAQAVLDER
jgi:adenylate cyclase